ncbi:hypothetical protein CSE6_015_27840 [Comamonas sp. E6]|nr:hypothetical protein CSE6_015_27840 [Comamonas sp. E6]
MPVMLDHIKARGPQNLDQLRPVTGELIRLHQELTEFKKDTLGEVADLVKIAGERYDVILGGKKGNVSISSYDGKYKVQRSIAEPAISCVPYALHILSAKAWVK